MTRKLLPAVAVVAVLAALVATIGYAVARAGNGGNRGYGSMMNGSGYAMMGGASGARSAWYRNGSGPIETIAAARSQAQRFADGLGLKTEEVIQFANNFYVLLVDGKGAPATEVLVDPETGAVTLEYGPAMMWNTRYGMMRGTVANGYGGMMGGSGGGMMGGSGGGMMGGSSGYGGMMGGAGMGGMMGNSGGNPNWTPPQGSVTGPVSAGEAQTLANRWLEAQGLGGQASKPDVLPGYFTFDVLRDGKITGMLSVNEKTGAVWYHWWHGRFVAMEE